MHAITRGDEAIGRIGVRIAPVFAAPGRDAPRRPLVVVVDGSRARMLSLGADGRRMRLACEVANPRGRVPGRQITEDRPGRIVSGGAGVRAMDRHTPPREVEAMKFARRIVERLERQHRSARIDAWALVAPPHLLGLIRGLLGPELRRKLSVALHKDLAHVETREIGRCLADLSLLPQP